MLRETAQVPPAEAESFSDFRRWRLYNANNLWIDLRPLTEPPDLPLILNRKTIAGEDVVQLETAMGAALGVIDGARVLRVPRSRFAPVKTTDDLLVVRSDAYVLHDDGRMEPRAAPFVALDRRFYGHLRDFDERFPSGPPSLVRARRLEVSGDVRFGRDVAVVGSVRLEGPAALAVALCLGQLALSGAEDLDRLALARLCARVENDWVGAQTGLLDQTASLLGEAGNALRVDFRTLDVEPVPFELGPWRLVSVDSGERHDLSASGYNARRQECARAARELGVASLRDATAERARRLPDPLDRRVRHVLGENERVEGTVAALRAGDLARVGGLLDASHASLRDLYDASTPAVERTVAALRSRGAAGARMVGGGFGGHVLALLPPDVTPPAGALEVAPSAGARLLD